MDIALVAEADRTGTNPGAALIELFRHHSPCLILIDEWVAYARQLYGEEDGCPRARSIRSSRSPRP